MKNSWTYVFLIFVASCKTYSNKQNSSNRPVELKIFNTEDLLYATVVNNTNKTISFNASSINNQKPFRLIYHNLDDSDATANTRSFNINFEKILYHSPYYIIKPSDSVIIQLRTTCSIEKIFTDSCKIKLIYMFSMPENSKARAQKRYIRKHNIWMGSLESNELVVPKKVVFEYCGK